MGIQWTSVHIGNKTLEQGRIWFGVQAEDKLMFAL